VQVVAVGAGKEDEEGKVVAPNLKAGDVVLYSKYSGTEFTGKDDKEYVVVKESDVLATIA
jgi:chaperonin GroES